MNNKTILIILVILLVAIFGAFYIKSNGLLNYESDNLIDSKNNILTEEIKSEKEFSNINITSISKNNEVLYQTLQKIGIEKAMDLLIKESSGGSVYDCHQESHQIGRIGYKIEKEKSFESCSADCHSGCYHGAMESLLIEKGTANLANDVMEVCRKFETSFGNFECLHGVGHGILAYFDYDMPQTITECKKLPDTFSQSSCYGGMFMENILTGQGLGASQNKTHQTEWVNKTDPYFPCNKINKDHVLQYQCYQMQTSWMLNLARYDFKKVSEQCINAPNNMQQACFKSLGRDVAGYTLRNPQKIIEICDIAPKQNNYYMDCIDGALNVIVDFWGPKLKNQASELCSITKDPYKRICYQILAGRLPGLFKELDKQKILCNTFEPAYQNLCEQQKIQ